MLTFLFKKNLFLRHKSSNLNLFLFHHFTFRKNSEKINVIVYKTKDLKNFIEIK